ncbi:MAG: ferritin family protein [Dehalococcoidales bacterium]|nr:ferritin family protein [Dehalococcoidales bacterium]
MTTEQNSTLEVLKIAIRMEIDGKSYYQKASRSSPNPLGKQLFQSLAAEEDVHRQKFEEIHDVISQKRNWPKTDFQPDRGRHLKTILTKAARERGTKVKVPAAELDNVKIAMDMENKTLDFYERQHGMATYNAEKDFYQALAGEERQHHLVLLSYYEYLKDPAAWFVKQEHPSLDGG